MWQRGMGQDYRRFWHDDYYNRRDDAREQGSRNGYRDGFASASPTLSEAAASNSRTTLGRLRGYQHWMGDKGRYKHEYREGYERGYRQAYSSYGYRRDRDGYRYHDRDDWR
jgi:hypothetical protein